MGLPEKDEKKKLRSLVKDIWGALVYFCEDDGFGYWPAEVFGERMVELGFDVGDASRKALMEEREWGREDWAEEFELYSEDLLELSRKLGAEGALNERNR